MSLAANVRALRQRAGLTQVALAERANLSRATIASIELGRYPATETTTLEALARALDVDPALLFSTQPAVTPEVDTFLSSSWAAAIRVSEEEQTWLKSLGFATWRGLDLDPQTLAELLAWRRRHLLHR